MCTFYLLKVTCVHLNGTTMDNLEEIKTRLSLLIDRFLCFDKEPLSSYLRDLHANGTIDIVTFKTFNNIISHAKLLKQLFAFIPFESEEQLKVICDINEVAEEFQMLGDIKKFPLTNIFGYNLFEVCFRRIRPHKTKCNCDIYDIYISF